MTGCRNQQSDLRTLETEPVAIIGIGCRFPGGANSPEAFWQLLRHGVDAITEVPGERFDIDAVYDPRPATPGKIVTRWGGFLEQVDYFDTAFFGISPREAARTDPQQRLLLEVAWEALEDAGQVPNRLAGSQTGVFVGMCYNDYEDLQFSDPTGLDIYSITGGFRSVAAGRLSYVLGVQGPSVSVDAACASSLVAVHLACQSLWSGECTLALAGGVNLILHPQVSIGFSRANMLAPDGRCKFCDARADGFVRSEGIGVVVLKPLAPAQAAGDPIHAVIRGSAVNNDGRCSGFLMTPSSEGQEEVLRKAYQKAGVTPGQVHYIEAHGTGTSAGDPVEVQALGAVLSQGRPKHRPCVIGSVKTNIGHTEGAAGIAGLIKVVLSMKHRVIPPSLHLQEPNPNIPWQKLPLVVQRELGPWPMGSEPMRAGVSSFGISGTNAHVVLEEAPQTSLDHQEAPISTTRAQLLTLSTHSPEALTALVQAYQPFVAAQGEETPPSLQDLCYTASVRRTHHDHRLALVVHSRQELAAHLEAFLQGEACPGMAVGRQAPGYQHKIVFVFPGQGSQWVGMGQELLKQEPVFREVLERCDRAMQQHVEWSLLEELTTDAARSRLDEVDIIQPALFAVQVALAALWRSWGIKPSAVVGQSMGEVAAAYVAGALSLEDATRVICRRSQLVKSTSGQGGMAVVGLALAEAQHTLLGHEDRVSVAVSSSPSSTVLSGDTAALQEILERLEHQGIFCSLIKVDYASHSPRMDPLRPALLQALEGLQSQSASLPIYSTVTGEVSDGREFTATYWVRNLREPVLFFTAFEQLLQDGHNIFLEMSPHPILMSAIQQGLQHFGHEGTALPSLRREEEERAVLLGSLGVLYTLGYPVDWSKLHPLGGRCVRLPTYPWQRERFWLENLEADNGRVRKPFLVRRDGRRTSGHPLLGQYMQSAVHAGTHFWETELSTEVFPYLDDHRVQGTAVLPAAAYAEIALAAAAEAFGPGPHALETVTFKKALFLPEESAQTVQLVVTPEMPSTASFQFFSLQTGDAPQHTSWSLHTTGTIRLHQTGTAPPAGEAALPEGIQARCPEAVSRTEHYQAMQARGLQYGPSFQGVEQLWRRDGEAIGQLRLPETVGPYAGAYQLHPALLDAGFQVLAAALPRKDAGAAEEDTYLPVDLGSLRVHAHPQPDTNWWSHALLQPEATGHPDTLEGDVILLDANGQVVVEARGLRLQRLERGKQQELRDWLYEIHWQAKGRPQQDQALEPPPPDQRGSWLIFADRRGVGQALRAFLEKRGETCISVFPGETYRLTEQGCYQLNPTRPADFRQLLKEAFGDSQFPCRGVVHLWSLEATPPEATTLASLETDQVRGCVSVLHVIQALAKADRPACPRLWLVTGGAQAMEGEGASVSVTQSPLRGLGRVIVNEHPEFRCTTVDLGSSGAPEEIRSLAQELLAGDHEEQIALRGEARYVARLMRHTSAAPQVIPPRKVTATGDQPFRLEFSTPGILENLTLRATTRRRPGPGEVEIQAYTAGLNFRDIMLALGMMPGRPVLECAGKISVLGEGVAGLAVGDEVIALALDSLGTHTVTDTHLVVHKPAHLSFAEAATIPSAFLTAYYALQYLGRMSKGERVLIHAASGGVGLAAVQLAQRVGAEIFATAGSPEKRDFLRSLGIEHVMDSRSLRFAEEVMELTNGEGVDLVLNSLAGEAIPKGLSILRPYGRFLELGKRDIDQDRQLGLRPFQKNLSFFAIDLEHLFRERPALIGFLWRDVMRHFAEGVLKPLPVQLFPISEVETAYRHMAQAKHMGKIVLSLQDQQVLVAPSLEDAVSFHADGTYLVTGGLGGLGLAVAQWMVAQGARHLVLVGRSGAGVTAQEALATMREGGAHIVVAKANVTQEQQMVKVLADIEQSMPPLRGIIHAAAVLDDGILLQLTQERLRSVMAPKMSGAWNLHTLTLDAPLDFFVLFSSVASLLGSPGQGNYVAANTFLDALAHYRRAQGRPALSINWGPWSEIGLAAAQANRGERLVVRGLGSITPPQGVEALGHLLRQDVTQIGVMPFNLRQWCEFYPATSASPLLAHLIHEEAEEAEAAGGRGGRDRLSRAALLSTDPDERQQVVASYLSEQIAKVLGLSASKLARMDVHQPLNRLGIDSLMTVELKNRIEVDLGMDVPVMQFLQGRTMAQLTTVLLAQLTGKDSTSASPATPDHLTDKPEDSLLISLRRLLAEEQHNE